VHVGEVGPLERRGNAEQAAGRGSGSNLPVVALRARIHPSVSIRAQVTRSASSGRSDGGRSRQAVIERYRPRKPATSGHATCRLSFLRSGRSRRFR